jgi:hypothetical protein
VLRAEVAAHGTAPDVLGKFHANCGGRTTASERIAAQTMEIAEASSITPLLKATAS